MLLIDNQGATNDGSIFDSQSPHPGDLAWRLVARRRMAADRCGARRLVDAWPRSESPVIDKRRWEAKIPERSERLCQ